MADSSPPVTLPRHAPPRWRSERARHLFLVYTRPVAERWPPMGSARRQRHTLPASEALLASSYSSHLELVKRPEALRIEAVYNTLDQLALATYMPSGFIRAVASSAGGSTAIMNEP